MVISRRVLLATGAVVAGGAAVVGAAQVTHRLDDLADAVGLDPKPQPDPDDDRLVARAATEAAVLLAMVEAVAAAHDDLGLAPFEVVVREQMTAVGGSTATTDVAGPPDGTDEALTELATAFRRASRQRAADAVDAVSPDLVRVLASMSAGLAQCAREIGRLR